MSSRSVDGFLVFFLVSMIPLAFPLGLSPRAEHLLFVGWRGLQLGALILVFALVLYGLCRGSWVNWLVVAIIAAGLVIAGLSYTFIEWDAQIEYRRVLLLADRYGGLWTGYRHGVTGWILGYPPGTSLSVMWSRWLTWMSTNMAQGVLFFLWSGSFLTRHMRNVDAVGKLIFFVMMLATPLLQWHITYFYNNLFFALFWAQFILVPMFGSSLQPWERCALALVMVWLRPQWQITAIAVVSGSLTSMLSPGVSNRHSVRGLALVTISALAVAWLGATHWQRTVHALEKQQAAYNGAILANISSQQNQRVLTLTITTSAIEQDRPAVPPLFSAASVSAIKWAYQVTRSAHVLSLVLLEGFTLIALVTLGRRGLDFLVPPLSPLALIVGTAIFARSYPEYRANAGALERMQIIIPILTAGIAAALHSRVNRPAA